MGWLQKTVIWLISASLLSFEIILTRIFAIEHEFHMSALAIALALLGFGAAGTMAALFSKSLAKNSAVITPSLAFMTCIAIPLSLQIAENIPLNLVALPWNPVIQSMYLAAAVLCFAVPFFLGALFIAILLMRYRDRVSTVISADLWGSAFGAIIPLMLIGLWGVKGSVIFAIGASGLAGIILLDKQHVPAAIFVFLSILIVPPTSPSEYKELSRKLLEPDIEVLWQKDSIEGRWSLIRGDTLHEAPGLSLNATDQPPPQFALFKDGNFFSTLLPQPDSNLFLKILGSAPYTLAKGRESALILDIAGSWKPWTAAAHRVKDITGVTAYKEVKDLLEGHIVEQGFLPDNTTLRLSPPRRLPDKAFDVILYEASAGEYGYLANIQTELLTQEFLTSVTAHLNPGGVFAVILPLSLSSEGVLRLVNIAKTITKSAGLVPQEHLLVVNDWNRAVIMWVRDPVEAKQLQSLREWAQIQGFDIPLMPGKRSRDVLFHQRQVPLSEPLGQLLLSESEMLQDYIFNISSVTQDRPFFYHVIHWRHVFDLKNKLGLNWPVYIGRGSLIPLSSLFAVGILGMVLIVLPLFRLGRVPKARTFIYFSLLGFGFISVEYGLLYWAGQLLGSPTASVSVVIAAMLFGAGWGSNLARSRALDFKIQNWIFIAIAILIVSIPFIFTFFFEAISSLSWWLRAFITLLTVTLIALPMGCALPSGIAKIRSHGQSAVAWSWGINGVFGVIGIVLAEIIAMEFGYFILFCLSALGYMGALTAYKKL